MGGLVSVDIRFPDMLARLKKSYTRIQKLIASNIQYNVGMRFNHEGAYSGHEKWKDLKGGLNKKTSANGLQTRQILKRTGALKNSIGPENANGNAPANGYIKFEGTLDKPVVRVGTKLKYAAIHNFGGTINHPGTRNKGFGILGHKYPSGFIGKGLRIRSHGIPIPRRNFTDWNKQDAQNMKEALSNLIGYILTHE